jgi:fumarate reductase subunit D
MEVITMLFDFITSTFVLAFGLAYRWLDQNVISHILVFVRSFEQALVMLTVIAFLLIMVYMMIKHVKRLPKSYEIEIVDIFGKKMVIDGLRLQFGTFAVAKSYSQYYTNLYGNPYQFRVVGRNRIVHPVSEIVD